MQIIPQPTKLCYNFITRDFIKCCGVVSVREINLQVLIQNLNLEVVLTSDVLPNISVSDLNRPGLELTGYFDYFAYDRIQILGKTEISFLESLSSHLRTTRLEKLLSYDIPCLIVTRNLNTPNELVSIARKNKKPILRTHTATTQFMSRLTNLLERELALRTTVHGVLVEIYGIGVLIIGESGIGKSETAIELIERGHRLVADDVVDIKQVAQDILIGTAPELIRHYLEVRGLGIIDVKTIFGAKSIRDNIKIEMVIELVEWENYKDGDR